MKKRSVAAVIILSIITCGIYMIYWTYVTCESLQKESGISKLPPILIMLLMLFVSPAGGALLGWDCNETVNIIKTKKGLPTKDNSVLWIVLGAIIGIVTVGLVQYEVNQLLDAPTDTSSDESDDESDDTPAEEI